MSFEKIKEHPELLKNVTDLSVRAAKVKGSSIETYIAQNKKREYKENKSINTPALQKPDIKKHAPQIGEIGWGMDIKNENIQKLTN